MPGEPLFISSEAAERVRAVVQRFEARPEPGPPYNPGYSDPTFPVVVRVQVTSGTATGGLYPCTFQTRDANAQTWTALAGTGWAEGVNGEALTNNNYYVGLLEGVKAADGLPIVMVFGGGGGGALRLVKCTAAAPDASGVYTAAIQTPAADGLTFTDGSAVMLADPDQLQPPAGVTVPKQLVLNWIYPATDSGKQYGGLPLYYLVDFDLTLYDNKNAVGYDYTRRIVCDSPGSTISADWKFTANSPNPRDVKLAHNGYSGNFYVLTSCVSGTLYKRLLHFENGLLKQVDAEVTA